MVNWYKMYVRERQDKEELLRELGIRARRYDKIKERVVNELNLALSCIDNYKKENNWKLLGFEMPIHNSIRWLKEDVKKTD